MKRDPLNSIARILKDGHSVAGTGFLAGQKNRLITCAHVVKYAGAGPGGTLKLIFYKDPNHIYTANVLQEGWREPNGEDIAVLELVPDDHPVSEELQVAALGSSFRARGKTLSSFGFPSAMQTDGVYGKCEVIGPMNVNGCPVLQVSSREVTYGFSGAPAWDENSGFVIGMVVSIISAGRDQAGRLAETAFITPIESVRTAYQTLALGGDCPYRGLEPFEEEHKDIYFGRDAAIDELIGCLAKNNLVAIVGVSGSGKSSLARAGLAKGLDKYSDLPGLAKKKRVVFKAGATPLLNLLDALNSIEIDGILERFGLPAGPLNNLEESRLLRDKTPLEIATILRESCHENQVLVVVDQFERLFTECSDESVRTRFCDVLLSAANEEIKILITLRADFYAQTLAHTEFGNAIKSAQVTLTPMTEDQLVETIVLPAQNVGREVEDDLIERLIKDVRDRPGDLSLLEFALKELWRADNERGVLTVSSYDQLGYLSPTEKVTGVRGALIKRAENEWAKQKAKGQEKVAERILLSLVTAEQTTQDVARVLDTSRRARLAEFDSEARRVAQELADSFLLTTGEDPFSKEPIIEVSHEALIRNWPRLQQLVRTYRPFVSWYVQDFVPYFQGWLAETTPSHKKKLLLPDVMLQEAQHWKKQYPNLLVGPRAEYVHESVKRHKRKRIYQISLGVATVTAALVIAFWVHNANESRGNELSERGVQALLQHDYQQAQLLLAESLSYRDSEDVRQHLLEARINGARTLPTGSPQGEILAISSHTHLFVFLGRDGIIKVWDRSSGTESATTFVADGSNPRNVRAALSSDESLLAIGDNNGRVQLWNLNTKQRLLAEPPRSMKNGTLTSAIDSLAIAPNGNVIAYGNMDGTIYLWDRTSPSTSRTLTGHEGAIHCLSFSSNGKKLASGGADSSVRVWYPDQSAADFALTGHEDFITAVAFRPSEENQEDQLASGSADDSVRVWAVNNKAEAKELYMLTGHLGYIRSLSFNPAGNLILSGSEDETVRLWDTSIRKEILRLNPYAGTGAAVEAVAFDETGYRVISASKGGAIRLWEISKRPEGSAFYNSSAVSAVAFFPNKNSLIFGDAEGHIRIWDLDTQKVTTLDTLPDNDGIDSLAIRRDGLLAVGSYSGKVKLFDTIGGSTHAGFQISKALWGLAFHPTRPWLAAGGQDKEIHLWNLQTGQEVIQPINHDNVSVWSISFSPDGQIMSSSGGDAKIRLWDMNGKKLSTFEIKGGDEMWGVPFQNDGKTLVSAGLSRRVQVWSVQALLKGGSSDNVKPLMDFAGHKGIIQSAALSANGEWIATGSSDQTVGLWNVLTKKSLRLELHERPVWWVTFSQDGKLLASGGIDRRVRVSQMDSINHIFTAGYRELLSEAKGGTCLDFYQEPLLKRLFESDLNVFADNAKQGEEQIRFTNCR